MSNLWEKVLYKSRIPFLIDTPIIEYDISKANINILRDADVISEEQYQYLMSAPKIERNIIIGKLQGKNPKIVQTLKDGIANARRIFIESNNIKDSNILEIRNDAVMVIGNPVQNLNITNRVMFRPKGVYTSFYRILDRYEYFYLYDIVAKTEGLDVKGLGGDSVRLHKQYMLDFLMELFYSAQIEGVKSAIMLLNFFYSNYLSMKLDIEYYRELNSQSMYRLNNSFSIADIVYTSDSLTNGDKECVDITFNENILRYLNSIYASIYFGKR